MVQKCDLHPNIFLNAGGKYTELHDNAGRTGLGIVKRDSLANDCASILWPAGRSP